MTNFGSSVCFRVLAGLISDWNAPECAALPRLNEMRRRFVSLPSIGRMYPGLRMYAMSDEATYQQQTLFAAASPVRMSALPDAAQDWLESDQDSGLSSIVFLQRLNRSGLLSKMCPVFYPATTERILPSSFVGWSNAGIASDGGYWTLKTSESPSAAAVCSLSEILEMDALPRYYLSAKAAQGILNRAARRGKELPPQLQQALQAVVTAAAVRPMEPLSTQSSAVTHLLMRVWRPHSHHGTPKVSARSLRPLK